jgi:protein TonB
LPAGANLNVRPPYPPEALARGSEGLVTLRVVVDEEGAVRSAKVETSSGDASLDQSALTTVRDRWHFEPAHRYGVPVECEVLVPIRFRLREGG